MARLVIVGSGKFGREVLVTAKQVQLESARLSEIVFIDDLNVTLQQYGIENRIICPITDYQPAPDDELISAISDPAGRMMVCDRLRAMGARFINLIHPTAIVADTAELGTGMVMCPFSIISDNVKVGDDLILNSYSVIGHDAIVGRGCTINAHCNIMGNTVLEQGVFFGGSACVIPYVKIREFAKVGAGSVVIREVKASTTVFGNPAKRIQ